MSIGEFELIRRYFFREVKFEFPHLGMPQLVLGIGDDAALLDVPAGQHLVVTTDTLVAGRHFLPDAKPSDIGWKALAVNLSDLAAMSATPLGVTLNLTLPEADEAWLESFSSGFWMLAELFDVPLIGGDTTRGPLSVTMTALGCVPGPAALRRSTAKADDIICVTGSLGDAGAGLALALGQADAALLDLSSDDKKELLYRLNRPFPRLCLGHRMRGFANAGMDISDGLLQDLGHLLEASNLGAEVAVDKLPMSSQLRRYAKTSYTAQAQARRWALSAGDDYELLFTISPEMWQRLASFPDMTLTAIGKVTKTPGLRLTLQGKPWEHEGLAGYQHF